MTLFRALGNSGEKVEAINAWQAGQHAQVFLSAAPVLSVMAGDFEMALGDIGRTDNREKPNWIGGREHCGLLLFVLARNVARFKAMMKCERSHLERRLKGVRERSGRAPLLFAGKPLKKAENPHCDLSHFRICDVGQSLAGSEPAVRSDPYE
jgi:hypothetical protein